MDWELTELVFILDRSGSMSGLEDDTIGGFNGTIRKQRKVPGRALVTTVLFDHKYEVLHDRVPLNEIYDMTPKEYYTRGCTALLDAMGRTITDISAKRKRMPKDERPGKTIFVIITDGYENASKEYTYDKVKELVKRKGDKGWEFLFLGANMDAVKEAERVGIGHSRSVTYRNDEKGTRIAYDGIAEAVCNMRKLDIGAAPIGAEWKDDIEKDTESRS